MLGRVATMLSTLVLFVFFINLSTAIDSNNIVKTAKEDIKQWKDSVKSLFSDKRSSYFFQVPNKKAIVDNYSRIYPKMKRNEKRRELIKLGRIAFYLRLAKDFLTDPRNKRHGNTYVNFPKPFLKNLDQLLEPSCTYNFKKCSDVAVDVISNTYWFKTAFFNFTGISGVFKKAETDIDKKARLSEQKVTQSLFRIYRQPFKDLEHQFEFSSTLSYYFCWFTMLQLPILAHIPYCDFTESWNSGFAGENIMMIDSWKMIDTLDEEPFRCAKYR